MQLQQRCPAAHLFELAVDRSPVQPLAYLPRKLPARHLRIRCDRLLDPLDNRITELVPANLHGAPLAPHPHGVQQKIVGHSKFPPGGPRK